MASSGRLAVVAAGGTGGHLFPAEATARALAARGWRIVLATDARGANFSKDFPAEERLALDAATFTFSNPVGAARGVFKVTAGAVQALSAFRRLRPAVVIGFGGYPSLPAMLAGKLTGTPTVIHAADAVLGRVNRALAPHVNQVACAFPTLKMASEEVLRSAAVVGNPVRPEIQALYGRPYSPPTDTLRLLVTGGSQGAKLLSETVPDAVALLPEALRLRLKVEQQTRIESLDIARRVYGQAGVEAEIAPFFRNMAGRLSSAHVVIGRAGASTVCEIATVGVPSILVPLAIAADDHQTFNAKLLSDVGAAEVIAEDDFTAERLSAMLARMLSDPADLARRAAAAKSVATPNAADTLAQLVERVAERV